MRKECIASHRGLGISNAPLDNPPLLSNSTFCRIMKRHGNWLQQHRPTEQKNPINEQQAPALWPAKVFMALLLSSAPAGLRSKFQGAVQAGLCFFSAAYTLTKPERTQLMTSAHSGRARTLEDFVKIMSEAANGSTVHYKPYSPLPGDVFITSWAKSGTTLLQQMFHQIRTAATGGDEDYDDISRVVPWEDTAQMIDLDMQAVQRAAPRGFKSHREYERLPPGMRYVVALRDPKETYVSFYRFLNGWQLERDALTLEEFMPVWLGGGPGGCDYFTHLLSWFARRAESDTFLTSYNHIAQQRESAIKALATFVGVPLSSDEVSLVLERTSRKYMYAHKDKFDDAMVARVLEERSGVPSGSDSSKVQEVGSRTDDLPQTVAEEINKMWQERVQPTTGFQDFSALAHELCPESV